MKIISNQLKCCFVGHEMAVFLIFFMNYILLMSNFVLIEITLLHLLYINKWHSMLMIDEDFLTAVCIQVANVFTALILSVNFLTQKYLINVHYQASRNLLGLTGPLQDLYPTIKFWYV